MTTAMLTRVIDAPASATRRPCSSRNRVLSSVNREQIEFRELRPPGRARARREADACRRSAADRFFARRLAGRPPLPEAGPTRGRNLRMAMRSWPKRAAVLAGILGAVLAPTPVRAQRQTDTWPPARPPGQVTVHVLDDAGGETTGRLLRLEPDSLVLLVDGQERRLEASRVRRLDKRGDSLKNGAYIGAAAGFLLGLLFATAEGCSDAEVAAGEGCFGDKSAFVAYSTGIYAAIGVGIDALHVGRTTLYAAPAAGLVQPVVPRGKRVALTLTFRW